MKRMMWIAAVAAGVACDDTTGGGEQPDYELSLAPAQLNVPQGATPTVNVTIARTNFTGGVALFLTGAPAQVSGTFQPATTNTSSSTLTVTVGGGVTPGVYTLVVNGNGAPGARTVPLPLTVTVAPHYSLEVTPSTLSIARGTSDTTTVTIQRSNFAGSVTLGLEGRPQDVTHLFEPGSPSTNSSRLTIIVGAAAPTGTHNLTVVGDASIGVRQAPLTLNITP